MAAAIAMHLARQEHGSPIQVRALSTHEDFVDALAGDNHCSLGDVVGVGCTQAISTHEPPDSVEVLAHHLLDTLRA